MNTIRQLELDEEEQRDKDNKEIEKAMGKVHDILETFEKRKKKKGEEEGSEMRCTKNPGGRFIENSSSSEQEDDRLASQNAAFHGGHFSISRQ